MGIEIDDGVIVRVEGSVEVGVAAVGEFDQHAGRVDGFVRPQRGLLRADSDDRRRLGNTQAGDVAGGGGGIDADAVPATFVEAAANAAADAGVSVGAP